MFKVIGNAIGNLKNGLNANAIVNLFEDRVEADGGIVESTVCSTSYIQSLLPYYTRASLMLIPGGYKESKLYSAKPTDGGGDFAFTRAGTSTRKGANLVEQVPYNLLSRSQSFDNASWVKSETTVSANVVTAPDGTLTADSIFETVNVAGHRITQSLTKVAASVQYTFTVHLKANGRDWIRMRLADSVGGTNSVEKFFNITTGVIGSNFTSGTGWTLNSASIEPSTNGFFKVKMVVTTDSGTSVVPALLSTTADGNVGSFAGDITKGFHAWQAQLVYGSDERSNFTTTDRFNVPKLDYTGASCPSILLEPTRTNLVLRSEEFDNASWTKAATTVSANTIVAPDGLSTADTMFETVATSTHVVQQGVAKAASALQYVISAYIKPNGRDWVYLQGSSGVNGYRIWFNVTTGVVGTATILGAGWTFQNAYLTSMESGWFRCVIVITSDTTTTINVTIGSASADNVSSFAGDITKGHYVWGAQLEQASYETSYIPTTSGTITRVLDEIPALSGMSSIIGQTQGTIYWDMYVVAEGVSKRITLSDGSLNNRILLIVEATNTIDFGVLVGGVAQAGLVSPVITTGRYKAAGVYANNRFALFVNGVKVGEDLSGTVPACNQIRFNNPTASPNSPMLGQLYSLVLFPTALSDSEAITLTTP